MDACRAQSSRCGLSKGAACPHSKVGKGLESRVRGREAQGAVVELRCRGMSLAIDPFGPAGGQAPPRPAGLFEQVHRMSGQREQTRNGRSGDAGTDYRDSMSLVSHDHDSTRKYRFIARSVESRLRSRTI